MRLARWKVMAGGLMLSAGGLMAVADGPPPVPGCQPAPASLPAVSVPASPAITRVSLDSPIAVPAPKVAELPAPKAELPALPKVETPQPKQASPFPNPDPAGGVLPPQSDNTLRVTGKATQRPDGTQVHTLPAIAPAPVDQAPLDSFPATKPGVKVRPDLPPVVTETPAPAPFVPAAAPAPAVPAEKPVATPEPKKPEQAPAPTLAEKRLKVVLHMGDDRPRFEVRDGEETYLKVVSDRVEVKSAAGNEVPTMKAGGKVAFVTPGGDGTCDELTILPGSGQVVAAGNVAFRHTWGRSETTVTSERMTFRLANPGPTAIQAGYTPVR